MGHEPDTLSDVIARIAAMLRQEGAREVYLFGSLAKGSATAGSDIDFAVVGLPPAAFYRAVGRALSMAHRSVDVVDLDQDSLFTRFLRSNGALRRVA